MLTFKNMIWLKQGLLIFQLPVNPERISLPNRSINEKVRIDGLGDATILQDSNLLEISFESELPKRYYQGCTSSLILPPLILAGMIESMKRSGPVRILITGVPFTLKCTIEEFSLEEKGGDVGTFYYTMRLQEYRQPVVKQVEVRDGKAFTSKASERSSEGAPGAGKNFVAKAGDTIWKVAKKAVGSGSRFGELVNLNSLKPPYNLKLGSILRLPTKKGV